MEYKLTTKDYKEALKQNKLLGLRCNKCGNYIVPPRMICPECGNTDLQVAQLSGKGRIQSFSTILVPPEGFTAPYIVGIVELEEGPWVMANIEGIDPAKASMELIGRKVKMGCKVLPGDRFSAGEWVALAFTLGE